MPPNIPYRSKTPNNGCLLTPLLPHFTAILSSIGQMHLAIIGVMQAAADKKSSIYRLSASPLKKDD